MDIARLFRACRVGDIAVVRDLVKEKDVDLNVKDRWDSSPLYYACLCGHTELVRFLLENGAKCEANTFDGERCVYGALTNEIRNILLNEYNVISKTVVRRRDYDEFLRKAYESGDMSDVEFNVRQVTFRAHKCILAARCQYFEQLFTGKWNGRTVVELNKLNPSAFKVLLQYLYTGILEFNVSLKEDLLQLLRQCRLFAVHDLTEYHCNEISGSRKQKSKQKNVLLEFQVNGDFHWLYRSSLPDGWRRQPVGESLLHRPEAPASQFSDVIFKVNGFYFHCHKLFFSMRSEFFRALTQDHFYESRDMVDGKRIFELNDISVEAFDALNCYVYTNTASISLDCAFELLMQSDAYLMSSLKKFCASIICDHVSQLNAIDLIKMSRMLSLPKLELKTIEYMSHHLEQFTDSKDFRELVISDAQEVKAREDTDTIDIIDNLRYYLNNSNSNRRDIDAKLAAIDALLESLNLRA